MANGNNSPRTFTSYPGSSFSKSPSLEMRALAQSKSLDGGYQKTSSMWSQVTRNRYPSGKMKVIGSSSSKKDAGLQSDLDYMQSIYDVLGMKERDQATDCVIMILMLEYLFLLILSLVKRDNICHLMIG